MKKELPRNIINPFSDAFLDVWAVWKEYKQQEFRFKYKGVISEQTALGQLYTISGKDEKVAGEIIEQSMANGWKGLFPIHKNVKNGKSSTTAVGKTIEFDRA